MVKKDYCEFKIPMSNDTIAKRIGEKLTKVEQVWDNEKDSKIKEVQTLSFANWMTFVFDNKKEEITISYDKVKTPKKYLKIIKEEIKKENDKLTIDEFKKLPMFSKYTDYPDWITDSSTGILNKKTLVMDLIKQFESIGITYMNPNADRQKSTIFNEPTLCMDLSQDDKEIKHKQIYFYPKTYELPHSKHAYITQEIDGESHNVGVHIPYRNLIVLFFNPFKIIKKFDLKDNVVFMELLDNVKKQLIPMKIKKQKTDSEHELVTIQNFIGGMKSRKTQLIKDISQTSRNIGDYENRVSSYYNTLMNYKIQLDNISKGADTITAVLLKEIKSIKKLSIVNKISMKDGSIRVEYIPTTIKVPNFTPSDSTKSFGKREIYIGRMVAKLSPNGITWSNVDKFKVESETFIHPHVDSTGHPCYGGGDASNLISRLNGSGKYTELIRYLWMWIRTCRDGHGYSRSEVYYSENLKKGYPIWDESGERILLNDKARVASGEIVKLEKHKDYDKNFKKFETFKRPR